MSRTDIPMDKPLSDEDRAYLLMRGEDAKVAWFDQNRPAEPEEDSTGAEEESADVESEEEPADNYEEWNVTDLQNRIKALNEEGAEITPASTRKADLIAALREYDALPDDEE